MSPGLSGAFFMKKILLFLLFLVALLNAENPDSTKAKIVVYKSWILEASRKFEINPVYLSTIIYVERSTNFDWSDRALDVLIAKRGYNSSIGFCQVKIKTAYWIETQVTNSISKYFPGKKYLCLLGLSKSKDELLKKLSNDSLNIHYSAAYIKIIQCYWAQAGFSIEEKPDIVGTLYSVGMFQDDGKPRKPHAHPKANWFGKKVKSSLGHFVLLFKYD